MVDRLQPAPFTGAALVDPIAKHAASAHWKPTDKLAAQMRVDASVSTSAQPHQQLRYPLTILFQNVDFAYRAGPVRAVRCIKYTLDNGWSPPPFLVRCRGYQRTHTINNFYRNGSTNPERDISGGQPGCSSSIRKKSI